MDLASGRRFSDADGRAGDRRRDDRRVPAAWDELHRRTARQTAAIQSGRFLGRD